MIALFLLIAGLGLVSPAYAENENAVVAKYCAVCHDDAHRNGGLSLQHFDIATVEPSLAAMMVSKLNTGAIGASGQTLPDKSVENGLFNALTAKSAGSTEWHLSRAQGVVSASILQMTSGQTDHYRLKLTCRPDTREGEMQLTWAPVPAQSDKVISVAADRNAPVTVAVTGREKMGNGAKQKDGTDATSGPASVVLNLPLPDRTLRISDLFPNQVVEFPFDRLTPAMRQELSACFNRKAD